MKTMKRKAGTVTKSGLSRQSRERAKPEPAPYALSCALYAIACTYLDRCSMSALISRIMRIDRDVMIASELTITLITAGYDRAVIARLWQRYML